MDRYAGAGLVVLHNQRGLLQNGVTVPGEDKFNLEIKLQALEARRESFPQQPCGENDADSTAHLRTIEAEIEFLKAQLGLSA